GTNVYDYVDGCFLLASGQFFHCERFIFELYCCQSDTCLGETFEYRCYCNLRDYCLFYGVEPARINYLAEFICIWRAGSSLYLSDHYGSLLEKGKQIWRTCLDDCWGWIICAFRSVLSRTAWHALCCIANGIGILCICYG